MGCSPRSVMLHGKPVMMATLLASIIVLAAAASEPCCTSGAVPRPPTGPGPRNNAPGPAAAYSQGHRAQVLAVASWITYT